MLGDVPRRNKNKIKPNGARARSPLEVDSIIPNATIHNHNEISPAQTPPPARFIVYTSLLILFLQDSPPANHTSDIPRPPLSGTPFLAHTHTHTHLFSLAARVENPIIIH